MPQKILGNRKPGLLFVISAPAGTGKTTLAQKLMEEFPEITESISCTTRSPRGEEVSGRDYIFMEKTEFETRIAASEFLEYAQVYGNYYGTRRKEVIAAQEEGKHVLLVIDTQGALQLMGKIPAVFIFISPPSLEELRNRLEKRKTETEDKIQERLRWAEDEIQLAKWYDYNVVNDDFNVAYEVLKSIIVAEEHRLRR